jgi:hypothetical protein
MAGAGKKTFTAGEVLTASDVNTYLMEQSVMYFGGTAARASAIPTPSTGMTTYIGVTGTATIPQIETYTGSVWQTPYGLTQVANVSFSAASSITIANVFSATYDNYKVVFSNMLGSQAAAAGIRIGAAATGYFACQTSGSAGYSGSTVSVSQVNNGTSIEIGLVYNSSNRSGATMEIQNPFLSTVTTFQSMGTDSRTDGAGARIVTGFLNNTTSYTDFFASSGGGTFSGNVRIYGYRNS